jgi:hypothetical protein
VRRSYSCLPNFNLGLIFTRRARMWCNNQRTGWDFERMGGGPTAAVLAGFLLSGRSPNEKDSRT